MSNPTKNNALSPAGQEVTVGRDVHYVSHGSPDGTYVSKCIAAKVTQVNSYDSVGLVIFNPTGLFFNTAVKFSADKAPGTWHWPEMV